MNCRESLAEKRASTMSRTRVGWAILLAAALAGQAAGQEGQGTVIRALDEPFSIKLEETPITAALQEIAARTGLSITLDDRVLGLLPHGEETRLRITARDVKLSEALDAVLTPMALAFEVRGMGVVVTPWPELTRINRRPTFTEVSILYALADMRMERGKSFLAQARAATGIDELELVWQVGEAEERAAAIADADGRIPCNGLQYLHRMCLGRGWTWYLAGTDITVVTEEMQTARQLSRPISVRYRSQPLLTVLQDLGRRADLRLKMDPGVLATLNDQTRDNFTLLMAEATVDEALQAISGATGLTFSPDGLGIRVGGSEGPGPSGVVDPARRRRADFLMAMTVADEDGVDYIVIFRPDELPEELVDRIRRLKAAKIATLRGQAGEPAATRPTNAPAAD